MAITAGTQSSQSEEEIAVAQEPPNSEGDPRDEKISFREVSPALEFMCWVVVALCPMLRLVNGAPVTDDQAAMQVFLVVASVASALGLRFYNWRVKLPNPQQD